MVDQGGSIRLHADGLQGNINFFLVQALLPVHSLPLRLGSLY
jgi:hypothetical protein